MKKNGISIDQNISFDPKANEKPRAPSEQEAAAL